MSTIHLHQTTTATPQQFLDALTDFGPGHEALFGNSAVVRDGKNLKGRALGAVLSVFGTRVLGKAFDKTVAAIEARNHTARTADHT